MILTLAVSGYRSLRDIVLPLERLTVIAGANGTGKSSLYRALRLLGDVAQGRAIGALAAEGGLGSTLWAGPETISRAMRAGEAEVQGSLRKERVALKLGFAAEDYGYAVDLGLPVDRGTAFAQDPEIKAEAVWVGECLTRRNAIVERAGGLVRARAGKGDWVALATGLPPHDSMMTHAADPATAPELLGLRDRMRAWRFYDHLRTDRDAPARSPRVGTRTPVLAGDGADLAAAIQTIRETGDPAAFDAAIADAFPGARVEVVADGALFAVQMRQRGLLRPLAAAELSDGTLRFLLLATALLTPRPPEVMVLNEPETSLHPELIPPLARLIAAAARAGQILVVSHSAALAGALAAEGALAHELRKDTGETVVDLDDTPPWAWPKR